MVLNPGCSNGIRMKASLKVARIFGIPIYLHVTLLLILPLFAASFAFTTSTIWIFKEGYGNLALDDYGLLALGVLAAIILFISILVHELAHSYVALRKGYTITGITLFIFGGVSQIGKTPDRAPGEALMAFVGPASSLVIGAVFTPLYLLVDSMGSSMMVQVVAITLSATAFYNLLLGAFNLVPAFPMDGGRVLRAGLAKRMGYLQATETSVNVGKVIAVVMGILGFIFNIWLILIAFFIFMGADEELRGTRVSEALRGLKVKDIMTKEVSSVDVMTPVSEVVHKMMTERHIGYPVLELGKIVGMITLEDVTKVPEERRSLTFARDVMSKQLVSIPAAAEAMDALQLMSSRDIGRLVVMQVVMENGSMVGIVTRSDIIRAVNLMAQAKGMRPIPPP
jgi:Zn-dependent protease/CBS domain-containing protein